MNQSQNYPGSKKDHHHKFVYQCEFFYKKEYTNQVNKSISNYFMEIKQFLQSGVNMKRQSPQLKKFNLANPKKEDLILLLKELQFCSLDKITQLNPNSLELTKDRLQQIINELVICLMYTIRSPTGFLMTSKNVYQSSQDYFFYVNYLSSTGYAFIMHQVSISIEEFYEIYPYLDSSFMPFEKFQLTNQDVSAQSQTLQQKQQFARQQKKYQNQRKFQIYLKSKVKSFAVILLQIIIKKNISRQLLDNENKLSSHHHFSSQNKKLLTDLIQNIPKKYQNLLKQNQKLIISTQQETGLSLYNFFYQVLVKQSQIQWKQLLTMNAFKGSNNNNNSPQYDESNFYHGYVFKMIQSELQMPLKAMPQNLDFVNRVQIQNDNIEVKKQFKNKQLKKRDKILQYLCMFIHIYIWQNLKEQERQEYIKYRLSDFTMFIPFYSGLQMEQVMHYKNWPLIFVQYNKKPILLKEYLYDVFQFLVRTCENIFAQQNGYVQIYKDKDAQTLLNNAKYLISVKSNDFYMNFITLISVCLRKNALLK